MGTVYSRGEFARRGEILDIYPPDSKMPLRVTFFDDEVESIRTSDSETQRSAGKPMEEYRLPPAREVVLGEEEKEKLSAYLGKQENKRLADSIMADVEEYGSFENADTFLPVMFTPAYIADYFPDAILMFDDFERIYGEAKRILTEFADIAAHLWRRARGLSGTGRKHGRTAGAHSNKTADVIDMAGTKMRGLRR